MYYEVFFESDTHAEWVATFETEELFIACFPALEREAKSQGMKVTEREINSGH
tara:strand:+ start:1438 stop:1596 length:159 start_codon:yes stop_codon:yes gene_type:complete